MNLDIKGDSTLAVFLGGNIMAHGAGINDGNWHSLRIADDGAGNTSAFLDNSATAFESHTGVTTSAAAIKLYDMAYPSSFQIRNFVMTSTAGGSTSGNVASVASATGLGALNLSTVTSAIQDVATYRAQNGANQSRLGFAAELNITNKANLESANSRIIDVDIAEESTQLARFNTLVQAGTSMLSQANQSTQIALKLLQ